MTQTCAFAQASYDYAIQAAAEATRIGELTWQREIRAAPHHSRPGAGLLFSCIDLYYDRARGGSEELRVGSRVRPRVRGDWLKPPSVPILSCTTVGLREAPGKLRGALGSLRGAPERFQEVSGRLPGGSGVLREASRRPPGGSGVPRPATFRKAK